MLRERECEQSYLALIALRTFAIRYPCYGSTLKYRPTLHSLLTNIQDHLPVEKQANIYEVPFTCRKVYIGETTH